MTNNTMTPDEIEREIEQERSSLTSSIEALQEKFSLDTVVNQVGAQFREHGGDLSRTITRQVRENPIPLALTGLGLAWMVYNSAKKSGQNDIYEPEMHVGPSVAEQEFYRTRQNAGQPYTPAATTTHQDYDGPSWSQDESSSIKDQVTDRVSSAVDSAKNTLSRIAQGTEGLTEEGRERVIAARRKAVELRQGAARTAAGGKDMASDFYDRQPLVIGALAIALGAALGGALPRTKTENKLMGAHSDHLFDEAERIFEDEKAKALAVASAVKNEVVDIAKEAKADLDSGAPGDKSAVEAVGDTAKSMANRVATKAKTTAKDKNLGKPKT